MESIHQVAKQIVRKRLRNLLPHEQLFISSVTQNWFVRRVKERLPTLEFDNYRLPLIRQSGLIPHCRPAQPEVLHSALESDSIRLCVAKEKLTSRMLRRASKC